MNNISNMDGILVRGETSVTADLRLESLLRRIRQFAASRPGAPAVRAGQSVYCYEELITAVTGVVAVLRERGIGAGDRVGIFCDRGFEAVVAMLAVLESGAAYVPLETRHPASYLEFIFGDSRPACLLAQRSLRGQLATLAAGASTRTPVEDLEIVETTGIAPQDATDAAYVMYTSGSTGRPKGVVVSREGLANYLAWMADAYEDPAWEASLVGSSLAVDLTVTSLFAPLLRGACVVMLPGGDPVGGWLNGLRETDCQCLIKTTPTQLKLLLPHLTAHEAARVAVLVIGGEALEWRTVRQWRRLSPQTRIFNEYGPTETVVGCTVQEVSANETQTACVPIGLPIANTYVHILDSSFLPCAEGATGELHIGGVGVAHGYLGRPALTASHFVPDPYGLPGARLYRSGDRVRWNDGALEFEGRRGDQLKIGGYRVEPGEIERVLLDFPGVNAAAVVLETGLGADATPAGESQQWSDIRRFTKPEASEPVLVAYLALSSDAPAPSYTALRQWFKGRLASHMAPGAFIRLASLPFLGSGKVDRKALNRSAGREISSAASDGPPRNATETALCEIVCDSLNLAAVGVHDNFFDIGGDSIRVISIHAAARARGVMLDLGDFFKHQTIAELASCANSRSVATKADEASSEPFSPISADDRRVLPAGVENAYPLARMQAGLIFHSYESQNCANYHDVFVYQISSVFDERLLAESLAETVQRHPTLRTSFALTGYSEPLQLVWRQAEAEFYTHDLRELDAERQQQALMDWITGEKNRPFDFKTAPLLRLHVHRIADQSAHWAISFHDCILDGWSLATLLVEIVTIYAGKLAGAPALVPPVITKYEEFVDLERRALHDESQRAFWVKYLEGCAAAMSTPRPAGSVDRSYVLDVPLAPELSEALQSVARLLRVSVKHVLLAAHIHVTGWMTGQIDVLTGVESHGRVEAGDGDRVLGMHLNTLPFRVQLQGGSWADLIESIHDAEQSIFPYRRYPYASIHKEQGGSDLFTTVFNYTHFHRLREIASLPGIEPVGGCGFGQRHYALSAEFNQDPFTNHLRLDLECNLAAGDAEYWDSIRRAYELSLRAIAGDPMSRYDSLAIDEQTARAESSASGPEAPATVVEQLLRQVADKPEAVAVADAHREITYGELHRDVRAIASHLQALGIGAEDCVGIHLDPGIEQITAVWGVLATGAAYVIIESDAPRGRWRHILMDAGVKVIVSTRRLRDSDTFRDAASSVRCVLVDDLETAASSGFIPPRIGHEQLAYITYTSGSTGAPKGVRVSHRNLAYSTSVRSLYYREPVQSFLLAPSLAYDSAVAGVYWTLCTGATLVIPSHRDARDPRKLIALIERYRVTHWLSVPALYEAVLRQGDSESLRSLCCSIVAGEACPARLVLSHRSKSNAGLFNEYGPSEATVWATVWEAPQTYAGSTVPIGLQIPGSRVYLLDYHLRPVGPGAVGQIYIGGCGVSRGYGSAGPTADRFLPDPFTEESGERMYRTGDLARRLAGGELEFVGRVDRQVKIRGYRVEPAEIEQTLRQLNGVQDVAVAPIAMNDEGLRLIAFVVPEHSSLQVSALNQACVQLLPAPLVPAKFVLMDALPRTQNGKVDVHYLETVRPGLVGTDAIDRVLACVEAMPASEVRAYLQELATKS